VTAMPSHYVGSERSSFFFTYLQLTRKPANNSIVDLVFFCYFQDALSEQKRLNGYLGWLTLGEGRGHTDRAPVHRRARVETTIRTYGEFRVSILT